MLEPIHQTPEKFDEISSWCSMPPKLIGEHVFLTAPDPECTDEILRFMTDETVVLGVGSPLYKASTHDEEYGILSTRGCNFDDGFNFLIWSIEDEYVIGICSLHDVEAIHRTASISITIGSRLHRGRGIGTETVGLLLRFAFEELDLFEISLSVYEFNEPAIACYEKCGFKEYGRRRQCRYVHGKRYDEIMMDILKEEYEMARSSEIDK